MFLAPQSFWGGAAAADGAEQLQEPYCARPTVGDDRGRTRGSGSLPVRKTSSSPDSSIPATPQAGHSPTVSNEQQQEQLAPHEAALQLLDAVASQELGRPESALQLVTESTAAVAQHHSSTASRVRSSPALPALANGSPALDVIHEDSSQDEPAQYGSVADMPHSVDPADEYNSRVKVGHASETSMLCRNLGCMSV